MNTAALTQLAADRALPAFLSLLERASDHDIGRLLGLLERIVPDQDNAHRQIRAAKQAWMEDRPLGLLLKRIFRDLNPQVRYRLVTDFILNNSWGPAAAARERYAREEHCWPPYTFLISPSMRCNLTCTGCYAGEYTQADDLPLEVANRVLMEGKEMGIHFVTVLGGEPLIRPDMWDLYARHSDVFFQVFTNGTLLTEQAVERLAKLGNVAPVLSIEGWQEETDSRRGPGTFGRIMAAMDRLRQAGVLFGFSAMVTRHNVETICSDAFNAMLVEKGCCYGWHFLYMPVGREPDLSLMPSPEQREYMRVNGAARIRNTWPMFVVDFWNDAPYVGGCIAGGKQYFHINARGDVEPCIFTHFAVDNVKDKSMRQVLRSPFFQGIRDRQPFDDNLLLPCQLIDHPHVFRQVFEEYRPYPTHPGAETLVNGMGPALDDYAHQDRVVMDPAWQKEFVANGFRSMLAPQPLPEAVGAPTRVCGPADGADRTRIDGGTG